MSEIPQNDHPADSPPSLTPPEVVEQATAFITAHLASIKGTQDAGPWMDGHHFIWAQLVRDTITVPNYYS